MENNVQNTANEAVNIRAEEADYTAAYEAAGEASRLRREKRKKNRRFNAILYCISAALILLGVFIILRSETKLFTPNSADAPEATFPPNDVIVINVPGTPQATEASADPSASTPAYPPPSEHVPEAAVPISIHFYDHDVNCSIKPVGVTEDRVMETVPSATVVGWFIYSAAPNLPGNCIIAGHNRYSGQLGSFSLLHNGLEPGDRVGLKLSDKTTCFYVVQSINTYPYDKVPDSVMDTGGERRLTLITCLGDFDYDLQMSASRVVAVCIPVE